MYPCSSCHRHLRDADDACPFCGVAQRNVAPPVAPSLSTFALAAVTVLGASACSTGPATSDEGNTTTSAGSSETVGESGSSESETTTWGDGDGDMTNEDSNASLSFYACSPPDDYWNVSECDPFAQDCPDGEKCVPYASTGGSIDANKCVPVTGAQAAGEACTYGGVVEATDDCNESSYCFHVDGAEGVCTPFCGGTADDPICDPGTQCLISNEGSITLCLASCHPVLQDCGDGYACDWFAGLFMCWLEGGAAAIGEECASLDACVAGSFCVGSELVPGCVGASCCSEYCDLTDMNFVCTTPGTECVAVYDEGEAPPGYENVGGCVVPPP